MSAPRRPSTRTKKADRWTAPYVETEDRRSLAPVPWGMATDPRLSDVAYRIGGLIYGTFNAEGIGVVSHITLSLQSGKGVRTIERATRELAHFGWLKIENRSRRADERKPCRYRACHPIKGVVKRPRIPDQMAMTLLALARGPAKSDPTHLSGAPDSRVHERPDSGVGCTKEGTALRSDRSRDSGNSTPESLGAIDWRTVLTHGTKPRRAG